METMEVSSTNNNPATNTTVNPRTQKDSIDIDNWSLVIKHLPTELSEATLKEIIEHFGGPIKQLKIWRSRGMAFVNFEGNETGAENALKKLDKMKLLNKVLVVEWAKRSTQKQKDKEERKKFKFQPNPALEYNYPKPTEQILTNIYNALASVPKLYTQVLHLMNKMNLPPPFPPNALPVPSRLRRGTEKKRKKEGLAEYDSESEHEDEEEEEEEEVEKKPPRKVQKHEEPVKRTPVVITHQTTKKATPLTSIQIHTTMFPEPSTQPQPTPSDVIVETSEIKVEEIQPETATPKAPVDMLPKRNVIGDEELYSNRMSIEEIMDLPLFKEGKPYDPGMPSNKIFVKNLHKEAQKPQLEYIFGRFFDSDEDAKKGLHIDVLEKRMKGHAFVTFPTVEMAKRALVEVHGYLLMGKPLILEFGRSSEKKKT